jgi:hypothetical protein
MALEETLTYVVAIAVPVWLIVEQVLMRRRAARQAEIQASTSDRPNETASKRDKAALRPTLVSELPPKAA